MRIRTPLPAIVPGATGPCGGRRHTGFTTVELLVVIAIVGLLASIAVPSFRNAIENTRVLSDAAELVNDIKIARSSAITAGRGTAICASADGSSCSASAAWNAGRIIYFGDATVTSPTTADTIKRTDALNGTTVSDMDGSARPVMTFNRNGFHVAGGAERRLRVEGPSGSARRCLILAPTGLSRLQTPAEGSATCAS